MMPSRINLATGIPGSKVKYSRLSTDDGFINLQLKKSPPKIPYKAIALATVLFLIGAFLIVIGFLLLVGCHDHWHLVFLPGFCNLSIAYYASKGYQVTPTMTFPTLMTGTHHRPEKSQVGGTEPSFKTQQKLWLRAKEFCSSHMFNKTMVRFYESHLKDVN